MSRIKNEDLHRTDGRFSGLFKYALPIAEHVYLQNPEYTSLFQPRIHKYAQMSDDATVQCQLDLFGEDFVGGFVGNLDLRSGGLPALGYPYCLPERLPLITYVCEFAFVQDDILQFDMIPSEFMQRMIGDNSLVQATVNAKDVQQTWKRRLDQAMSKSAVMIAEMDPEHGKRFFNLYNDWKQIEQKLLFKTSEYQSLEDYLTDRFHGSGWPFIISLGHFGSGILLTEEEDLIIQPLYKPLYDLAVLANDYFSWEKERSFQEQSGGKIEDLSSAVTTLMALKSVSEQEAMKLIKDEMHRLEDQYLVKRDAVLARRHELNLSDTAIFALDLMEAVTAGHLLWSTTTKRYHSTERLEYKKYLKSRRDQGAIFYEDCLYSDSILGTYVSLLVEAAEKTATVPTNSITVEPLEEDVVRYPSNYVQSLPSKGVRDKLIDGLSAWYQVPEYALRTIHNIIKEFHNGSLMLDDIQDNSTMRRGMPATHIIYGTAQTINSAYLLCVDALQLAESLSPSALSICLQELRSLHVGQGYDLYWTYNSTAPTEKEYLQMIDAKTSAQFRLCSRLLQDQATINKHLDLGSFMTLFGRYFQIRDDYKNLVSSQYISQKGFCSDLDEGKYSLPIIHAMQGIEPELAGIFQHRKRNEGLSDEVKQFVLQRMKQKGSLEYTQSMLRDLEGPINEALDQLERRAGRKNWVLRQVFLLLRTT